MDLDSLALGKKLKEYGWSMAQNRATKEATYVQPADGDNLFQQVYSQAEAQAWLTEKLAQQKENVSQQINSASQSRDAGKSNSGSSLTSTRTTRTNKVKQARPRKLTFDGDSTAQRKCSNNVLVPRSTQRDATEVMTRKYNAQTWSRLQSQGWSRGRIKQLHGASVYFRPGFDSTTSTGVENKDYFTSWKSVFRYIRDTSNPSRMENPKLPPIGEMSARRNNMKPSVKRNPTVSISPSSCSNFHKVWKLLHQHQGWKMFPPTYQPGQDKPVYAMPHVRSRKHGSLGKDMFGEKALVEYFNSQDLTQSEHPVTRQSPLPEHRMSSTTSKPNAAAGAAHSFKSETVIHKQTPGDSVVVHSETPIATRSVRKPSLKLRPLSQQEKHALWPVLRDEFNWNYINGDRLVSCYYGKPGVTTISMGKLGSNMFASEAEIAQYVATHPEEFSNVFKAIAEELAPSGDEEGEMASPQSIRVETVRESAPVADVTTTKLDLTPKPTTQVGYGVSTTPIDFSDVQSIWRVLKSKGWSYSNGDKFHSFFYLKPGVAKREGVRGETMFTDSELLAYAQANPAEVETPVATRSVRKSSMRSRPLSRQEKHALWPVLRDEFNWNYLNGDQLVSCYYGKPGVTKRNGKLGSTLFASEADIAEYVETHPDEFTDVFKAIAEELAPSEDDMSVDGEISADDKVSDVKVASSTSTKVETEPPNKSTPDQGTRFGYHVSTTPINMSDFNAVWRALKAKGWRHAKGDLLNSYFFLKPNVKKKNGIRGETMFSEKELLEYAQANPAEVETPVATRPVRESSTKSRPLSRQEKHAPIAEETDSSSTKLETVPPNKSTPDQGTRFGYHVSTTPINMSDFNAVWRALKAKGWRHAKGDLLNSYFFLKPNVKKKNGIRGETMFSEKELLEYAQANPAEVETPVATRSVRKSSMKSRYLSRQEKHALWPVLRDEFNWNYLNGDQLVSCYYGKPGVTKRNGKLGSTLFASEADIAEYVETHPDEFTDVFKAIAEELAPSGDEEGEMASPQSIRVETVRESTPVADVTTTKLELTPQPTTQVGYGVSTTPIDFSDVQSIWRVLKSKGWSYSNGDKFHSFFYLKPGVAKREGVRGETMFTDSELLAYAQANPAEVETPVATRSVRKSSMRSRPLSRQEKHALWPVLRDEFNWNYLNGDQLVSCYYGKPGVTKRNGKLGSTLFASEADIAEYVETHPDEFTDVFKAIAEELAPSEDDMSVDGEISADDKVSVAEVASSTSTKLATEPSNKSTPDQGTRFGYHVSTTPINMSDFNAVWRALKAKGWRHAKGDLLNSYFFLKPNVKKKNGIRGETMFSEKELLEYAQANPAEVETPVATRSVRESSTKSRPLSQQEKHAPIAEETDSSSTKLETVPPNKSTPDQGTRFGYHVSTTPINMSDFNAVWRALKAKGWRHAKSDLLNSYFFLKPNVKKKNGIRGETMFTEKELLEYAQSNPAEVETPVVSGRSKSSTDSQSSESECEVAIRASVSKAKSSRGAVNRRGYVETSSPVDLKKFSSVWEYYRSKGWRHVDGDDFEDFFFVKPNVKKSQGVRKVTMFSQRELMIYAEQQFGDVGMSSRKAPSSTSASTPRSKRKLSVDGSIQTKNSRHRNEMVRDEKSRNEFDILRPVLWKTLRRCHGWNYIPGGTIVNWYLAMPHVTKREDGIPGKTMFANEEELTWFFVDNLAEYRAIVAPLLRGEDPLQSSQKQKPTLHLRKSTSLDKTSKPTRNSNKNLRGQQQADDSSGSDQESLEDVSHDPTDIVDVTDFNSVWKVLKRKKWKHLNGQGLQSYCYCMPHVSKRTEAVEGKDLFPSEDALLEYVRSNPSVLETPQPKDSSTVSLSHRENRHHLTPVAIQESDLQAIAEIHEVRRTTKLQLSKSSSRGIDKHPENSTGGVSTKYLETMRKELKRLPKSLSTDSPIVPTSQLASETSPVLTVTKRVPGSSKRTPLQANLDACDKCTNTNSTKKSVKFSMSQGTCSIQPRVERQDEIMEQTPTFLNSSTDFAEEHATISPELRDNCGEQPSSSHAAGLQRQIDMSTPPSTQQQQFRAANESLDNRSPLEQCKARWVGRADEIEHIAALLGDSDESSPPILVVGHTGTGKTSVIRDFCNTMKINHAYVNCLEVYSPAVLFNKLVSDLPETVPVESQAHDNMPLLSVHQSPRNETEYESRRRENIAQNIAVLQSMGIQPLRKAAETVLGRTRHVEEEEYEADRVLPTDDEDDGVENDIVAFKDNLGISNRNGINESQKQGVNAFGGRNTLRCDKMHDFILELDKRVPPGEKFTLVLDHAERLQELKQSLIPSLLRLNELSSRNVSVIMITQGLSGSLETVLAGNPVIRVPFPVYRTQLLKQILVTQGVESGHDPQLYRQFVSALLQILGQAVNDLRELMFLADQLWQHYVEPVANGELTVADRVKLLQHFTPHAKCALAWAFHHDVHSEEDVKRKHGQSAIRSADLPYHGKLLLLASYLASYNPIEHDRKLFGYSAKRRRFRGSNGQKKRGGASKRKVRSRISQHMVGPKSFEMERLLWIYRALLSDILVSVPVLPLSNSNDTQPSVSVGLEPAQSQPVSYSKDANSAEGFHVGVYRQIPSMVNMGLLCKVSRDGELDETKYKCLATREYMERVAKTMQFELESYLYE